MKKEQSVVKKLTLDMTWDELYQSQVSWYDNFNMSLYGEPSRKFQIGELVKLGNLNNVHVVHEYGEGIYAVQFESIRSKNDIKNNAPKISERRVVKWIDISNNIQSGGSAFVSDTHRRPTFISSSLNSIIHMFSANGIIMDTRFQRSYVWDDDDREALLDTIFNQGTISSFLFTRLSGYKFKDNIELEKYSTITGDIIEIQKCDNNSISVIDGQQRITTLLNFYLNRFKYKGYYFNELSGKDYFTFLDTPISYALVDESDGYTLKNWVWLFLQANKGVSQTTEHLVKMEEYYKTL